MQIHKNKSLKRSYTSWTKASMWLSIWLVLAGTYSFVRAETLPENRYFSPNLDGKKDVLYIPLKIKDTSLLKKWSVSIYQKNKNIPKNSFELIKTIRSLPPKNIKKMTLQIFWEKLLSVKQNIGVPQACLVERRSE